MHRTHRIRFLAFVAGLTAATAISAQKPGDALVLGHQVGPVAMHLGTVPAGGAPFMTGLVTNGLLSSAAGLTPAPLNDGVVFTARQHGGAGQVLVLHFRRGILLTLNRFGTPVNYVPDVLVDQNGDLLLLNQAAQPGTSGIFRLPFGSSTLSTLVAGIPVPLAMEEDLVTGGWLVTTGNGDVYRVSRLGHVTSLKAVLPIQQPIVANQHSDFLDGSMIVAAGANLLRLDPRFYRVTTLLKVGPRFSSFVGIDFDPINGESYCLDSAALFRYNPASGRVATLTRFGMFIPTDVAVWGGRMLTGQGSAAPGARYPIDLSMPGEAARFYQAAASFGALFGIVTPAGRIPLDPDALFFLSFRIPAVFQNFGGTLSLAGHARLTVAIPNHSALKGHRFFVAAISFGPHGIRLITEPLGITIQ